MHNKGFASLLFIFAGLLVFGIVFFSVGQNFDIRSKAYSDVQNAVNSMGKNPKATPTPLPQPTYYVKTSDWVPVSANVGLTLTYGCNDGDIAISGGLYEYSGNLNDWRTIRSAPSDEANPHAWTLTVVNESTSGQFIGIVKCLKLQ